MYNMFMQGDRVKYYGHKYSTELNSKVGVVLSTVKNESGAIVVDFGDEVYILNEVNLRRAKVAQDWELPKRRRNDED